jgi:hypothetical protein
MDNIKCPVCGKAGIPDYHNSDVVCPQCGTDLSIYRVIDQIPTEAKNTIWKPISAVAIIAAAVLGTILLIPKNLPKVDIKTIPEYVQLQDSIGRLNSKISELANRPVQKNFYLYIVKKGDCFWTISKRVYGTATRYKEIADYNGMTINAPLHTGDTLKIE